jgi:hypothetical protein
VTRRRLLRAGTGGAAGIVGIGALSGVAAAGEKKDCDDPPASFPRVTTRDHFDVAWYGSVYLTDGHTETDYDTADGVPGRRLRRPGRRVLLGRGRGVVRRRRDRRAQRTEAGELPDGPR